MTSTVDAYRAMDRVKGILHIKMDEEEGITITSDNTIIMSSEEDIELSAKKLEFKAEEGIYLISGESSIILDGDTHICEEKVTLEGLIKGLVHVEELVEEELNIPMEAPHRHQTSRRKKAFEAKCWMLPR